MKLLSFDYSVNMMFLTDNAKIQRRDTEKKLWERIRRL